MVMEINVKKKKERVRAKKRWLDAIVIDIRTAGVGVCDMRKR